MLSPSTASASQQHAQPSPSALWGSETEKAHGETYHFLQFCTTSHNGPGAMGVLQPKEVQHFLLAAFPFLHEIPRAPAKSDPHISPTRPRANTGSLHVPSSRQGTHRSGSTQRLSAVLQIPAQTTAKQGFGEQHRGHSPNIAPAAKPRGRQHCREGNELQCGSDSRALQFCSGWVWAEQCIAALHPAAFRWGIPRWQHPCGHGSRVWCV